MGSLNPGGWTEVGIRATFGQDQIAPVTYANVVLMGIVPILLYDVTATPCLHFLKLITVFFFQSQIIPIQ